MNLCWRCGVNEAPTKDGKCSECDSGAVPIDQGEDYTHWSMEELSAELEARGATVDWPNSRQHAVTSLRMMDEGYDARDVMHASHLWKKAQARIIPQTRQVPEDSEPWAYHMHVSSDQINKMAQDLNKVFAPSGPFISEMKKAKEIMDKFQDALLKQEDKKDPPIYLRPKHKGRFPRPR